MADLSSWPRVQPMVQPFSDFVNEQGNLKSDKDDLAVLFFLEEEEVPLRNPEGPC